MPPIARGQTWLCQPLRVSTVPNTGRTVSNRNYRGLDEEEDHLIVQGLSMSGKLCLRHFLRIPALFYKCIVHVCSECHVCVRHSLGLIYNFENKLARYNESNCNTILIVVI